MHIETWVIDKNVWSVTVLLSHFITHMCMSVIGEDDIGNTTIMIGGVQLN